MFHLLNSLWLQNLIDLKNILWAMWKIMWTPVRHSQSLVQRNVDIRDIHGRFWKKCWSLVEVFMGLNESRMDFCSLQICMIFCGSTYYILLKTKSQNFIKRSPYIFRKIHKIFVKWHQYLEKLGIHFQLFLCL